MSAGVIVAAGIARLEESSLDADAVTPGVIGFIITAVFALAVILLGWDLVRRLRRSRYREEIRQSLAEELAERDGAENGERPVEEPPGDEPRS